MSETTVRKQNEIKDSKEKTLGKLDRFFKPFSKHIFRPDPTATYDRVSSNDISLVSKNGNDDNNPIELSPIHKSAEYYDSDLEKTDEDEEDEEDEETGEGREGKQTQNTTEGTTNDKETERGSLSQDYVVPASGKGVELGITTSSKDIERDGDGEGKGKDKGKGKKKGNKKGKGKPPKPGNTGSGSGSESVSVMLRYQKQEMRKQLVSHQDTKTQNRFLLSLFLFLVLIRTASVGVAYFLVDPVGIEPLEFVPTPAIIAIASALILILFIIYCTDFDNWNLLAKIVVFISTFSFICLLLYLVTVTAKTFILLQSELIAVSFCFIFFIYCFQHRFKFNFFVAWLFCVVVHVSLFFLLSYRDAKYYYDHPVELFVHPKDSRIYNIVLQILAFFSISCGLFSAYRVTCTLTSKDLLKATFRVYIDSLYLTYVFVIQFFFPKLCGCSTSKLKKGTYSMLQ